MTTNKILEEMPDAVCLQECSEDFFKLKFNNNCNNLLDKYYDISHNQDEPGVCILINKNLTYDSNIVRVGGNSTYPSRTGGKSKKGVGVLIKLSDVKQIWVCCVHLQWEKPGGSKRQANNLINDLFNEIKRVDSSAVSKPIVLTGDFNMSPEELHLLSVPLVAKNYFHSFQKVNFDEMVSIDDVAEGISALTSSKSSPTGLTGDFSKEVEIDYILYKNLNPPESTQIHLKPEKSVKGLDGVIMSAGPYKVETDGSIGIQTPSDHGCMEAVFEL